MSYNLYNKAFKYIESQVYYRLVVPVFVTNYPVIVLALTLPRLPEPTSANIRYSNLQNNLNSTCVLIDLQVCFPSTMKHENDVIDMIGCLH